MTKVKLADLIDALEFQSDLCESFVSLKTGNICMITDDIRAMAENKENVNPGWAQEEIQIYKDCLENPDDYIELPSRYEINEYNMMEEFAYSVEDQHQKEKLLIALQGKGAFRRFQDTAAFLELIEDWYLFRGEQYEQFARNWCEEKRLELID